MGAPPTRDRLGTAIPHAGDADASLRARPASTSSSSIRRPARHRGGDRVHRHRPASGPSEREWGPGGFGRVRAAASRGPRGDDPTRRTGNGIPVHRRRIVGDRQRGGRDLGAQLGPPRAGAAPDLGIGRWLRSPGDDGRPGWLRIARRSNEMDPIRTPGASDLRGRTLWTERTGALRRCVAAIGSQPTPQSDPRRPRHRGGSRTAWDLHGHRRPPRAAQHAAPRSTRSARARGGDPRDNVGSGHHRSAGASR